jgi:tetratricopeptide (TPR) repeat protein
VRLGAGRVLLGSAIATPTELTLSGSLLRVADGATLATGVAAGPPDSVAVLVNRLTARLLSQGAGESRERMDGLAATSLEALQDYLAGRAAYRNGDYHEAMDLYARAFGRDSTFAQAAFGLVITNPLLGTVMRVDGLQLIPTVWRLRDRLSPRDLALFRGMAFVGPNYPGPSSYAEIIAQAERAATAAADSPEHWWSLGGTLSRYGAAASVDDWPARAADALDRAIALDSSFTPAVEARLYVAMWTRDLPVTGRLAALLEAPVAAGSADAMMLWAAALTLGDSAGARRWRGRVGESDLNFVSKLVKMALHSVEFGLPLADARWANATLRREGPTEDARGLARLGELAVAMAEGRMTTRVALWLGFEGLWEAANLTLQATVEPMFREAALEALNRVEDADEWPPLRDCHAELWRLGGGDTSTTRASIRRLRAFASREPPPIAEAQWGPLDFRVCPLLLEAILEGPPFGARSGERLEALDALMRTGPRWLVGLSPPAVPVVEANWTIARLREAQGDIPAALAAIRRRENSYYPAYLWTLVAFLRQEGRLAALAGDAAGARRAYDQFLALRTDPDSLVRPQRDSVLQERAVLEPR